MSTQHESLTHWQRHDPLTLRVPRTMEQAGLRRPVEAIDFADTIAEPPRPTAPIEEWPPMDWRTLGIALLVVAVVFVASSFFPLGFAQ